MSYWRERARPIIAAVLRETNGQDEREIRKALTEAYPFGPRRMWPYKAYLTEVKYQRGLYERRSSIKVGEEDPSQLRLLDLDGGDS